MLDGRYRRYECRTFLYNPHTAIQKKGDGQEAFKMMTVEVSHCPMTKGGNSDMCVVYHRA